MTYKNCEPEQLAEHNASGVLATGGASSLQTRPSGKKMTRTLPRLTLIAASFGFFMVILDTTIVNVALPDIQRALETSIAGLQWVVDGYSLVFASLLLTTGALSDRIGSKKVFLAGLVLFVLTSALCGMAPSLTVLIVARLLQGVGAALLVPASLALISHAYPDRRARAGAIGIWAAISAVGAAAGPVAGGILVQDAGWRSVFLVNVPVGIIGILITLRFAIETPAIARRSLDLVGQCAGIVMLSTLTFALIEGHASGWNSLPVLLAFLICIVALITFLIVEQRNSSPMLPLTLFRMPTFSAATCIGVLLNFSFYGLIFLLSVFFQQVQGYSAIDTGLRLLPLTVTNVIATSLSGRLTGRIGPRMPIAAGLLFCALGIFTFLLLGNAPGTFSQVLSILSFLAIGFGGSFPVPALTAAILGTVKREQSGIASGVLNASRQAGGVFGVAVLGSFLTIGHEHSALSGIQLALGIAGGVLIAGGVIALLFVSSQREHLTPQETYSISE